ncbi:unnamed protein product [Oikopleura dioica]|uniref:Phospholipase A2 domain-containing protein n=1 Tax=Oikopleura dioica TaxID=34765 RepID=E4XIL7_OIKDI|nr:unnamed protein product [Oikopleura dioica]
MSKGPPVDEIDRACMNYKHCLACSRLHLDDNNCIPELIEYTLVGVQPQCPSAVGNNAQRCKSMVCQCDKMLVNDLLDLINGGIDFDAQNYMIMNTDKCFNGGNNSEPGPNHGNNTPRQCCGEFPAQILYRPSKKQCCLGKVRSLGTCSN